MVAGKKPMTKAQVVSHIAQECGIQKKDAVAALEGIVAWPFPRRRKWVSSSFRHRQTRSCSAQKPAWAETPPLVSRSRSQLKK